jgi:C4-dicarboxylate transporter DctQ subunit
MKRIIIKSLVILDRFNNLLAVIAGVLMIFVVLYICSDVVIRNVFNKTLPQVIAISEVAIVFITFLATAWLMRNDGHVRMDFILVYFSPKYQYYISLIFNIVGMLICAVLTWFGIVVVLGFLQTGVKLEGTWEIPRGPVTAVLPLGFMLLFIEFLRKTCTNIIDLKTKKYNESIMNVVHKIDGG